MNTKMNSVKKNKVVWISLFIIDLLLTLFLFIISIVMLIKTNQMTADEIQSTANVGFIAYLQKHPTFYLCVFVVPLFVLLAANIIGLVFYTKKVTKSEPVKIESLSDDQKNALLNEMLEEQKKKNENKK